MNYDSYKIKDWLTVDGGEPLSGLRWIKSKPGSGKSVLMKDAYRCPTEDEARSVMPIGGEARSRSY